MSAFNNIVQLQQFDKLEDFQQHFINSLIKLSVWISPFWAVGAITQWWFDGWQWVMLAYSTTILTYVFLFVFGNSISLKTKVNLIVFNITLIGYFLTWQEQDTVYGIVFSLANYTLLATIYRFKPVLVYLIANSLILIALGSQEPATEWMLVKVVGNLVISLIILITVNSFTRRLLRQIKQQLESAENERQWLMHALHEKMGSALSQSVHQLNTDQPNYPAMLTALNRVQAHIKLSNDIIHLDGNDLEGMLAGLRFRLVESFQQANIALHWPLNELPPLKGYSYRDLQAIQEKLYNQLIQLVEQGSHIDKVTFTTQYHENSLHLIISYTKQNQEHTITLPLPLDAGTTYER